MFKNVLTLRKFEAKTLHNILKEHLASAKKLDFLIYITNWLLSEILV